MNTLLAFALACILSLSASCAFSQNLAPQMPSVERVISSEKGSDRLDTAARQRAALMHMASVLRDLSEGRDHQNQLDTKEKALLKAYMNKAAQIERQTIASFTPADRQGEGSLRQTWFHSTWQYERDTNMRSERVRRLLPASLQEKYFRLTPKPKSLISPPRNSLSPVFLAPASALSWDSYALQWQTSLFDWNRIQYGASKKPHWFLLLLFISLGVLAHIPGWIFRNKKSEALRFTGGTRNTELTVMSGTVAGEKERSDTYVFGSGGGANGQPVHVSSSVTIVQTFFLQRPEQPDYPVRTVDSAVPLANGQHISLILGFIEGRSKGGSILRIVNHSSKKIYTIESGTQLAHNLKLIHPWSLIGFATWVIGILLPWAQTGLVGFFLFLTGLVISWLSGLWVLSALDRRVDKISRELLAQPTEILLNQKGAAA